MLMASLLSPVQGLSKPVQRGLSSIYGLFVLLGRKQLSPRKPGITSEIGCLCDIVLNFCLFNILLF